MENFILYLVIALTILLAISLTIAKKNNLISSAIKLIIIIIACIIAFLVGISVLIDEISIISGVFIFVNILIIFGLIGSSREDDFRENSEKIPKNYPKLSIIGIMRERKENQKIKTVYLLLIATIIYIFAGKLFSFAISNIFLSILLGSVLLIALELLIFNYRVNKGWYGSSELEVREIIKFITKNAEDIDFTDGNNPKSIIRPEDIQQIGEEVGIQFPGYPEPNAMNKGFREG